MFFLIWRGWGILVPVFVVLGFVVGVGFSTVVPGAHSPYTLPTTFAVTGLVASVGIWFVARAIEKRPGRIMIDKATGKEFKIGVSAGSLFFIPTRYWAFIAAGLALVLAVTAAVNPKALEPTSDGGLSPASVSGAAHS